MTRRLCASSVAALVLLFGLSDARADEKADACLASYEQAQTLRKDSKLRAAKEQAAICAKDECPAMLAKDCTRWFGELESSIPTVVFDVRGAKAAELLDVKIGMDGKPLVERLDGKAVAVDPGSHVFTFDAEGYKAAELKVVVREGEKSRKLAQKLEPVAGAAAPGVAPVEVTRPVPTGVWIFGGASVVALGIAGVFGVQGLSKKSDLDACGRACPPGDVDSMSSSFAVADVALGAGVVAGLATLYLYLTRPEVKADAKAPAVGRAVWPLQF
ncbi:MAG: hypothetical protein KC657_34225 [Myxococcales bacterium]|nr:hypothetical protein [Myxococcales bacterium]